MGMFGQSMKNMRRRRQDPLLAALPIDAALETPEPIAPAQGMFGANKLPKRVLGGIGAALSDFGAGLRGGQIGYSDKFAADETAAQQDADWAFTLDGMDLPPEVKTFAQANPDAFKKYQFEQTMAASQRDKDMGLLSGLDLPPELMARASLNPKGFAEELGKGAGVTRERSYIDPVTGQPVIMPELYDNGGFTGLQTADGLEGVEQRPLSWQEQNERDRIANEGRKTTEDARKNREQERLTERELGIRDKRADTDRMFGRSGVGSGGSVIDDPSENPPIPGDIDYRPGGRDFDGAKVIKIGIGPNGQWVQEDDDGEMTNGIPAPMYSDLIGDEKSWGPAIRAENKYIDEQTTLAGQIRNRADKANEFLSITQEGDKPYITGDGVWMMTQHPLEAAGQMLDPRRDRLDKLNKELTIDMGQGMKGAFSDADRVFLMRGVPSKDTREDSNVDFAKRQVALANRAEQYDSWLRNYRAKFKQGTLKEAQRYWDDYKNANPVFDSDGHPHEDIPTITEWFGGAPAVGKEKPFNRKAVDPSKPKSSADMSDDELKKKLGLK